MVESNAIENSDRNQSDSICIMEKARDNVCTEALRARARFPFRLPSAAGKSSHSLSLTSFNTSSSSRIDSHWIDTEGRGEEKVESDGTKEFVNGFIWIRSSPYLFPSTVLLLSLACLSFISSSHWFTRFHPRLVPIFTLSNRKTDRSVFPFVVAYVAMNGARKNCTSH